MRLETDTHSSSDRSLDGGALVSVIIPTFNRSHSLRDAIDSALHQTHRDVEVLVVDDGSTDGTQDVLASYDDSRLRCHIQPNRGVAAARNLGIRASRGAYVAFLDSDDTWAPWKLEAQLSCMSLAPGVGMVWTNMQAVDAAGLVVSDRFLTQMYDAYDWVSMGNLFESSQVLRGATVGLPAEQGHPVLYVGTIFSQMLVGNLVHTSTVLMTRSRLEEVGEFNESFQVGEDYDFHLRTCLAGPVALLDVSSVRYSIGEADRLTRREFNLQFALNYLETVGRALADHPDRIALPKRTIRRAIARGHSKAARAYLALSRPELARAHLATSLRLHPWQISTAFLALITLLPEPLSSVLGRGLAAAKRRFRPRVRSQRRLR